MLTKEEAIAKVERKINDSYCPDKPRIIVINEATIKKDWGWVFFYQSSEFLKTQNISSMLVGNAPFIVNKINGKLIETGTALPIEHYILEYENNFKNR